VRLWWFIFDTSLPKLEVLQNIAPRGANTNLIENGPILANSSSVTVDQIAREMGKNLTTSQKSKIGREVIKEYRRLHPGTPLETVEKYVNGEMRQVKAYPREFIDVIQTHIRDLK